MISLPARRHQPAISPHNQALTPQETRWVEEFLIDLDAPQAALRVGLTAKQGKALLNSPRIQHAVSLAKRRRANRLQLYGEDVLRRWDLLARTSVNELVEVRRVNCRHCNGEDNDYQFTKNELNEARRKHELDALRYPNNPEFARPFDIKGGPGYNQTAPPSEDCPECNGLGVPLVLLKDTRNLSEGANLLYDGIKTGPGGAIELKVRSRQWAEEMVARHIGMFNDRRPIETLDPSQLTDSQLDEVVTVLMERGVVALEGNADQLDEATEISDVSDAVFEEAAEANAEDP